MCSISDSLIYDRKLTDVEVDASAKVSQARFFIAPY